MFYYDVLTRLIRADAMSDKSRGASVKLKKTQRRQLLLTLKVRALDGAMQAAHA
jgi:hypothetical protein